MIVIKILITTLMLCVSFVLISLSGFMNYKYGLTLGNSPQNAQIFGAVSVALDLMKAMLPLVILILWRQKNIVWFTIASVGFAGLMVYSLSNSFGFSMKNRSSTSQTADLLKDKRQDLRLQLKTKRKEKSDLPAHRPVDTVKANLEAARQHKRWGSTSKCSNATVDKSRDFCTNYATLKAELSTAKTAALLNSQLVDIQTALTKLSTQKTQMTGDVQANAIASYFAISKTSAQTNMSIFLSFLSEFGSSFGLIFTSFYWNAKPASSKKPITRKPATRRKKTKQPAKYPVIAVTPPPQALTTAPAEQDKELVQSNAQTVELPPSKPTETILNLQAPKAVEQQTHLSDFINQPGQTVNLLQQVEQDFDLGDFIEQTLVKYPNGKVQIKPLFRLFEIWCKTHHIEPIGQIHFIEDMNILLGQEPLRGSYHDIQLVA